MKMEELLFSQISFNLYEIYQKFIFVPHFPSSEYASEGGKIKLCFYQYFNNLHDERNFSNTCYSILLKYRVRVLKVA
jgi:hypothetical protein